MPHSQEASRLIAGQASFRELRRELHPSTVMWRWGNRQPEEAHGRRLRYINPFRDDHHPSLDVWFNHANGEWRVGDMAENWEGSSIDLEQRFSNEGTQDAADACRAHYAWQLEHGVKYTVNTNNGGKFLWKPPEHHTEAASLWHESILREKPCLPSVAWLREHFDIVISRNEMVWAPSYGIENPGEVVAYKTLSRSAGKKAGYKSEVIRYRTEQSEMMATTTNCPIMLAEGESDTWVLTQLFGEEYAVIGFPGAGADMKQMLRDIPLDRRKVVIIFDGDEPGTNYRVNLAEWLNSDMNAFVNIVPMYEGKDAAALDQEDLVHLVQDWQQPYEPYLDLVELNESYFRTTRSGNHGAPVSDWIFDVERMYISENEGLYAYGGKLLPNNKPAVLLSSQLDLQPLKRWCREHRVSWTGNASDVEKLGAHLRYQATLAPVARMTTRVGLHRGTYVWPDKVIGPGEWTYIAPDIGMDLKQQLALAGMPQPETVRETVDNLVNLHDQYVTTTMLSWLAAAPLRPLFERFPIMHVTGLSGSGKTTLTQVMLWAFSGTQRLGYTLTSTTPYGIAMLFEAVNSVPIWFDEYRPGARSDAKMFLDQTMRDAYTGQLSVRGDVAVKGARLQQFRTDAPILVTGEDTLTERSHLDRAIILHLNKNRQNPEALKYFDFVTPITMSYLDWLVRSGKTKERIITQVLELEGGNSTKINERQKRNLWVLRMGHALLNEWLSDINAHTVVPELDWTALLASATESAAQDPLIELILWALDTRRAEACFEDGRYIYIHPTELLRIATAPGGPPLTLPYSSAIAMRSHLVDQYEAKPRRITVPGTNNLSRMYQLDADLVIPVD